MGNLKGGESSNGTLPVKTFSGVTVRLVGCFHVACIVRTSIMSIAKEKTSAFLLKDALPLRTSGAVHRGAVELCDSIVSQGMPRFERTIAKVKSAIRARLY